MADDASSGLPASARELAAWDVARVAGWLRRSAFGGTLAPYAQMFAEEAIDGAFLLSATENDFRHELGMRLGHARRLVSALDRIAGRASPRSVRADLTDDGSINGSNNGGVEGVRGEGEGSSGRHDDDEKDGKNSGRRFRRNDSEDDDYDDVNDTNEDSENNSVIDGRNDGHDNEDNYDDSSDFESRLRDRVRRTSPIEFHDAVPRAVTANFLSSPHDFHDPVRRIPSTSPSSHPSRSPVVSPSRSPSSTPRSFTGALPSQPASLPTPGIADSPMRLAVHTGAVTIGQVRDQMQRLTDLYGSVDTSAIEEDMSDAFLDDLDRQLDSLAVAAQPHDPPEAKLRNLFLLEASISRMLDSANIRREALLQPDSGCTLGQLEYAEQRTLRLERLLHRVAGIVSVHTANTSDESAQFAGPKVRKDDLILLDRIGLDANGEAKGKQGSELWSGRMGQLNFPVCIKKMNAAGEHATKIQSFENEVNIFSQVHHPNICTFLAACFERDIIMLVTELCTMDLTTFIRSVGSEYENYSLVQKLDLGKGICQGMAWLHSLDIVHCDLKPDNVLLDRQNVPKIADFGYSRLLPGSVLKTRNDQAVLTQGGSPLYMSPERLRSDGSSDAKASDVYSFAIILWETVTGEQPFEEFLDLDDYDNAHAVYVAAVCDQHARPKLPTKTHRAIVDMLDSAWHADPARRPMFSKIVDQFDDVIIRVACPDVDAAHLWRAHFITRQLEVKFDAREGDALSKRAGALVKTLEYEVSWEKFKWVFCGAIGLDVSVTDADIVSDPSSNDLGSNPSDEALYLADEAALDRYAHVASCLPSVDPNHPRNRVNQEKIRRELVIKLDAARELLCDPRSQRVTLERFGKITAMFGPLAEPSSTLMQKLQCDDAYDDDNNDDDDDDDDAVFDYNDDAFDDDEALEGLVKDHFVAQSHTILDRIFDLMNKPWFRRDMNSQQAWEILRYEKVGAFILRFSTRQQALVFSVVIVKKGKARREVVHVRVTHTRPGLDTPPDAQESPMHSLRMGRIHEHDSLPSAEQEQGFSMPSGGSGYHATLDELVEEQSNFLQTPITQATAQQGSWLRAINTNRRVYFEETPVFYVPSSVLAQRAAQLVDAHDLQTNGADGQPDGEGRDAILDDPTRLAHSEDGLAT